MSDESDGIQPDEPEPEASHPESEVTYTSAQIRDMHRNILPEMVRSIYGASAPVNLYVNFASYIAWDDIGALEAKCQFIDES